MSDQVTLVLGGARSGKSLRAEALALETGLATVYLATATAGDAEMRERIAEHRARRGPSWALVEEPLALAEAIAQHADGAHVLLVDCLTLWLSNLLFADRDLEAAHPPLLAALREARGPVVLVSNEVGLGIVPDNALARRFRDAQGRLNQAVAGAASRVEFMAAGLPLTLKSKAA